MKFNKSKLADLGLADLEVLREEGERQLPMFSEGSPDRNYFESLLQEVAHEKQARYTALIEKEDDEKTDAEKEAGASSKKK